MDVLSRGRRTGKTVLVPGGAFTSAFTNCFQTQISQMGFECVSLAILTRLVRSVFNARRSAV